MEVDGLEVTSKGAVGEIVLNRPAKLNPLSPSVMQGLIDAAAQFDGDREVRAVVIRGAGRAFCGGADLGAIGGAGAGEGPELRSALDLGRRMADAVAGMRALTVAAIHGHCVGGGLVLALACDIRIAAEGTRFAIPEVDLGIPLAWGGIPRMVRELGPAVTKELVLTCRPFDAEEALRLRVLNRVVPTDALGGEATAIAEKLASQPAYALQVTKRHVDAVAEEMGSTAQAFRDADSLLEALRDEESLAAMRRYMEGRSS